MRFRNSLLNFIAGSLVLWASCFAHAQTTKRSGTEKTPNPLTVERHLAIQTSLVSATEIAANYPPPLRCDSSGNIYLNSELQGVPALKKINPKGERVAIFSPSADSSIKFDRFVSFALGRGDLYALVYAQEISRYMYSYDADGKYKSTIKLDPGFPWAPRAFAVFPEGGFLMTGTRYVRNDQKLVHVPFTGLFKPDGTLIKEVSLDDDSGLQQLKDDGDKRVTSVVNPDANHAIDFSMTDSAEDGKVYLMRWMNPAILYAIAPSGEVVRRFTVQASDSGMQPMAMHISGARMAILFLNPQTGAKNMRVVDLEGNDIATYLGSTETGANSVSGAFVCYSSDPEKFTFLGSTAEHKLRVIVTEGK